MRSWRCGDYPLGGSRYVWRHPEVTDRLKPNSRNSRFSSDCALVSGSMESLN